MRERKRRDIEGEKEEMQVEGETVKEIESRAIEK